MNKGVLIVISLFLILFVGVVSAAVSDEDDNKPEFSDSGVEYDSILKAQFLVSDWVHVTVDIKDFSNIIIPDRRSPDFESKLQERNKILIEETNAVLSTLSEEEFQLKTNSEFGGFFSGNITKGGFDKLLKDKRVKKIYADKDFKVSSIDSKTIVKNLIFYLLSIILIIALVIFVVKRRKSNEIS